MDQKSILHALMDTPPCFMPIPEAADIALLPLLILSLVRYTQLLLLKVVRPKCSYVLVSLT